MRHGFAVISASRQLREEVVKILIYHALELEEKNQSYTEIKEAGYCQGVIKTDGRSICLGALSGQLFEADLETESGTIKVKFINCYRKTKASEFNYYSSKVGSA